ncbi:uncharacterized protein LOC113464956, partial [Ceratina calcarata]|uniref:Uncharacterized protein LOC113464956 n=1 Tax=Ceratina calcarata TaxID=156304 RepID=A0AAJ7S918_9HYME
KNKTGRIQFPILSDLYVIAYLKRGHTDSAANIMIDSTAKSIIKQYESSLRQWWWFTRRRTYDVHITDRHKPIEFLTERYLNGAKYGTLNSDRSFIALITKFEKEECISWFMVNIHRACCASVQCGATFFEPDFSTRAVN